jgi:hypothetical protein
VLDAIVVIASSRRLAGQSEFAAIIWLGHLRWRALCAESVSRLGFPRPEIWVDGGNALGHALARDGPAEVSLSEQLKIAVILRLQILRSLVPRPRRKLGEL